MSKNGRLTELIVVAERTKKNRMMFKACIAVARESGSGQRVDRVGAVDCVLR